MPEVLQTQIVRELSPYHKNGIRVVATLSDGYYTVEMWQRAVWGVPYCKVSSRHLKSSYNAAMAAMRVEG